MKHIKQKKHRICIIINYPLYHQMEKGNIDLLEVMFNNLLHYFEEVHVVSTKDDTPASFYKFRKGIIIHTIPPVGKGRFLRYILSVPKEIGAVSKIVKDHKIDVIRAMAMLTSGLVAVKVAKKHGIPAVVSIHEDRKMIGRIEGIRRPWPLEKCIDYAERYTLENATLIPVISDYVGDSLAYLKPSKKKLFLHPNFAYTDIFTPAREATHKDGGKRKRLQLLFMGRLTRWKYPDVMIRAVGIVSKEFPQVKLIIAGNGSMREELETLAEELGLKKNVEFAGNLSHLKQLPKVMRESDMLVVGVGGFTIMEEFSSGIPVVSGDFEWASEAVVNGKTGWLVKNIDDPQEYADAILRIAKDPALKKKIGIGARKTALERFSKEAYEKREIEIYRKVLKDDGRVRY